MGGMSALVERLIASRDRIKWLHSARGEGTVIEAREVMADAANALTDAEAALKLAVTEIKSLRRIANRETHWCEPAEFVEGILALSKMGADK